AFLGYGKIAAAGMTAPGSFLKTDFALAHYNADGSPDTSFSPTGHITSAFGGEFDFVKAAAFQQDETIVATAGSPREGNFLTASYNADGSPNLTFGAGGQVSTHFDGNGVNANAVAVQQDRKIVVVGNVGAGADVRILVVRYNTDGSLDSGFGSGG